MAVDNYPVTGKGDLLLACPIGPGSFTADAYLSAAVFGGTGSVHVYAQGDKTGIADWWFTEQQLQNTTANLSPRANHQVPSGTSVLRITYDFTEADSGGVITLETKAAA